MKIGIKYNYYEEYRKPIRENYSDEDSFTVAFCCWELCQKPMLAMFVSPVDKNIKMKVRKHRVEKTCLKIGAEVDILRWDENGINSKVKVTKIKEGLSRIVVYCDKGYFHFSKYNHKKDNIIFTWTCRGKKWNKKYQRWVNGNYYYYENKCRTN
ncbi:hypothetical protein Phi4:1_gp017 [Cellulophaga phage phi4:1]|uniref:Uncharacterized protein n=5 Tax=Lightbulbvirus TaxID=1918522 RepID=A0A0S2MWC5_9CAUD|nr:hypothetical protein Phi4:1_gp017 [Cellulophaga phage phi4:1]YP_008241512.1 hypothetical protein Phi17:2_gp017 [Cellulophaga phage phi17:2]ALO80026.1 hypothetical protein Phi4113_017 [Cellulophaga phage phi4:1_13]ALO80223.1 hypothetical protein Phi4118_017 [Cellulophaga phage phi4:1_18]ALO80420.1 hypothetical protein Phi17218_017 [Cellulophaga phage phi17:2_18]AGO47550.1 hypothetical protein Phi17:2_gp017 [Cellulophaga phage phi17:2]AGO49430.1 hypothetical protein Phi4:1_gp017 [Cellulophag